MVNKENFLELYMPPSSPFLCQTVIITFIKTILHEESEERVQNSKLRGHRVERVICQHAWNYVFSWTIPNKMLVTVTYDGRSVV